MDISIDTSSFFVKSKKFFDIFWKNVTASKAMRVLKGCFVSFFYARLLGTTEPRLIFDCGIMWNSHLLFTKKKKRRNSQKKEVISLLLRQTSLFI